MVSLLLVTKDGLRTETILKAYFQTIIHESHFKRRRVDNGLVQRVRWELVSSSKGEELLPYKFMKKSNTLLCV